MLKACYRVEGGPRLEKRDLIQCQSIDESY